MARSTRRSQDFSQQGPLMRLTHLLDSSVFCQPLKPEPLASVEKRWRELGDQALAKASAKKRGNVCSDFDLLIGATASVHGLILATLNAKHFRFVYGLVVEDWSTSP